MKKIIKLTALASAILSPTLVSAQATSSMEVSATVETGCFIEADNINFGSLIIPISTQTAQSDMRVHCSKGSNLSIQINYNGQISNGYTLSRELYRPQGNGPEYNVIDSNNNFLGVVACGNRSNYSGYVAFSNQTVASLYNLDVGNYVNGWRVDTTNVCNHTTQTPNPPLNTLNGQGVLTGLVGGEQIKYSVEVPNNESVVWNSINKYNIVATGLKQSIPMKAKIVALGNPTHRMTADSYTGTMDVVLTY
jgi:spore coat protein U-like protein